MDHQLGAAARQRVDEAMEVPIEVARAHEGDAGKARVVVRNVRSHQHAQDTRRQPCMWSRK